MTADLLNIFEPHQWIGLAVMIVGGACFLPRLCERAAFWLADHSDGDCDPTPADPTPFVVTYYLASGFTAPTVTELAGAEPTPTHDRLKAERDEFAAIVRPIEEERIARFRNAVRDAFNDAADMKKEEGE